MLFRSGLLLGTTGLPAQTGSGKDQKSSLAPKPSPEKEPKRVELGVEVRWRFEARDNTDFRPADDLDRFLGQRVRLHLRVRAHPDLSLYVQGQDVWLFGAGQDKVIHELGTNLHQAYLDWKPGGSKQWELRAGRQELIYGEERLVGPLGWDNVARSFEIGRASCRERV